MVSTRLPRAIRSRQSTKSGTGTRSGLGIAQGHAVCVFFCSFFPSEVCGRVRITGAQIPDAEKVTSAEAAGFADCFRFRGRPDAGKTIWVASLAARC